MSQFKIDEQERAKLEARHKEVRASMTADQREIAEIVDQAFDEEVKTLDTQYAAEANVRMWAKDLCNFELDVSEIERLRDEAKSAKNGTIFAFSARRGAVNIYKTSFGTIARVDVYINTLERAIIDITNSSQFTALTFRGLIKLAFKRLFNRSK